MNENHYSPNRKRFFVGLNELFSIKAPEHVVLPSTPSVEVEETNY